jgi:prefoldin alpha subunit
MTSKKAPSSGGGRTVLSFDYDDPESARAVARSVRVEAGDIQGGRTTASVDREGATVTVAVDAADLVAMRAGINTWTRLVAVAERCGDAGWAPPRRSRPMVSRAGSLRDGPAGRRRGAPDGGYSYASGRVTVLATDGWDRRRSGESPDAAIAREGRTVSEATEQSAAADPLLEQALEAIDAEEEELEGEIADLEAEKVDTDEAIEAIETLETGSTVQVPLGGGAYVRAEIQDIDEIIVGLGADYAAEQEQGDAIDTLETKKETIDDRIEGVREEIAELQSEREQIEQQAQQMQQQQMQQMQQMQQQQEDDE